MAKRRVKKRTHVGAAGGRPPAPGNAPAKPGDRSPKSMVIRIGAGDVGPSVSQLVQDVRSMMEPGTATRLKERRSNRLRDYTTMAGPLGVSHLLLFSRSERGNVQLRLAVTPRGPTLHFRVEKYSLSKDVSRSMKRPKSGGSEYLTAPLLVMNNFTSQPQQRNDEAKITEQQKQIPKHLESLTTTIFQSLFPPIHPTTTPLRGIKRVLLLDRQPQPKDAENPSYTLNLRHYAIETRTAKSLPKPLRKLDTAERLTHNTSKRKRSGLPNLSRLNDVADFLLDPHAADGFTSGSESEPETDAEVEVLADTAQKVMHRKHKLTENGEIRRECRDPTANVERKAIKLHELGPRLRLRLTKVEEGVCGAKVMWHEYIHMSKEELREMERVHEQRRREKAARREEQRVNVERKRAERRAKGEPEVQEGEGEDEETFDEEEDGWDNEDEDEDQGGARPGAEDDKMEDDGGVEVDGMEGSDKEDGEAG